MFGGSGRDERTSSSTLPPRRSSRSGASESSTGSGNQPATRRSVRSRGSSRVDQRGGVAEDVDDVGAAADLAVEPPSGFVERRLRQSPCAGRRRHARRPSTYAIPALSERTINHGPFMEPRGCNRWQPFANRRASKKAGKEPKQLPWLATSCVSRSMVRRGSTVRVRQRASQRRWIQCLFRAHGCRARRRDAHFGKRMERSGSTGTMVG